MYKYIFKINYISDILLLLVVLQIYSKWSHFFDHEKRNLRNEIFTGKIFRKKYIFKDKSKPLVLSGGVGANQFILKPFKNLQITLITS